MAETTTNTDKAKETAPPTPPSSGGNHKPPAQEAQKAVTDKTPPKKAAVKKAPSKTKAKAKEPNADEVFHLSISNIHIEKDANPRVRFDKDSLSSMASTIKRIGILHPLVVRLKEDGKYYLVSGERRLRAAKIAGLSRIPVTAKEMSDAEAEFARLSENLQREDLNAIEQARAYQRVIGQKITKIEKGKTEEITINAKILAEMLGSGHSQGKISQYLSLLDLPKPIQTALLKDQISFAQAREICGVKGHDAQMKLFEKIQKGEAARASDVKAEVEKQRATKKTSGKRRGRPPQTSEELPNISRQGLETALERLQQAKVGSKKVKEVRTSLATLYERHENSRSEEKKIYWKGAIAYAEWLAGFRDSF